MVILSYLLDCGYFFLIGEKKCPQSRIEGYGKKMTAVRNERRNRNTGVISGERVI